jgi:ribosomal protein L24
MSYFKGDRVVIVRGGTYKDIRQGATGTVFSAYNGNIGVVIDGINNPRSSYNCFYFTTRCIKHIDEKETNIMEGNYRIAQIKFLEGNNTDKTYHYACYDPSVYVDDICVVMSEHHGLGIARVVALGPKTDEKITREIVCKCDFSDYERRVATRKRKAELLKLMHNRAAELQEIALFQMLADKDASMQSILSEYQALEGAM